jgi:hypothetical protein
MDFDGYDPDDPRRQDLRKQKAGRPDPRDLARDIMYPKSATVAPPQKRPTTAAATPRPHSSGEPGSELIEIREMLASLLDGFGGVQEVTDQRDQALIETLLNQIATAVTDALKTVRSEVVSAINAKSSEIPASQLRHFNNTVGDLLDRHALGSRSAVEKLSRDVDALAKLMAQHTADTNRKLTIVFWGLGICTALTLTTAALLVFRL